MSGSTPPSGTRGRTRALVIAAGVAVLGAGVALAYLLLLSPRPGPDVRPLLAAIDVSIAGGYSATAREALASIRTLPAAEGDQLSVLKRAFEVARLTGDFKLPADLAERALATDGGSAPIRAVAAWADMRAGRLAAAERVLARGRLPAGTGEQLRGEAALRRGGAWAGSDALTRDLLSLEKKTDPAAFSAAALGTGDRRLALDAALLAMERGAVEGAARIARSDLADAPFDEPAALVLYDSGDPVGALERLSRLSMAHPGRADVALQMADALEATGDEGGAERQMLLALSLSPALSWTPYANLAWLARSRGDAALAARRLEDGLAFFPGSRDLRLAQARLAVFQADEGKAVQVLSSLVADHPEDGEASLALLELEAPQLSPEQYRARLWKTFDRVPSDSAVFAALSGALIVMHDWEGAGIALRQHEQAGGPGDSGALLVKGMIAAMEGDDAASLDAFHRSASLARDGIARFDASLVLLRGGKARAALAELAGAEDELRRNGSPADRQLVLSRFALAEGSARLLDGDLPGARTALARALSLDPRNLRAGLLLRKLEAEDHQ